jgi:hypothetical protein
VPKSLRARARPASRGIASNFVLISQRGTARNGSPFSV